MKWFVISCSAIFTLAFSPFEVNAQSKYLWPLSDGEKYGYYITSAFGEYRADRFHAGIDIKTVLESGHKVVAIDNGYLLRIHVSPMGYGRSLSITLNDGNTAVYGHLRNFAPRFQKIFEAEQQRTGSFSVDMWFSAGDIPIKRGEIIGTTGRSGTLLQHLHFELRDSKNRPVNPIIYKFPIKDTQPPHPEQLCFRPMNLESSVEGNLLPFITNLQKKDKNKYILDKPVIVWGDLGVSIKVSDQNGVYGNNYGIYKITLSLNNQELFSAQYDSYDYADNRLINVDRDYQLLRRDKGLFQKLYIDEGNTLPFYGHYYSGNGVIHINDSTKNVIPFEIRIYDICGNQSVVQGTLQIQSSSQSVFSNINQKISGIPLPNVEPEIPKKLQKKFTVVEDYQPQLCHITFSSDNDLLYLPRASFERSGNPRQQLPVQALSRRKFVTIFSVPSFDDVNGIIPLSGESKECYYMTEIPLNVYNITPHGRTIFLPNNEGTVVIPEGAVSREILFRTFFEQPGDSLRSYDIIGNIIYINPKDEFLRSSVQIKLRYPPNDPLPDKLGIYMRVASNEWQFLGDRLQSNESIISTEISSFETIAIIRDTVPPVIWRIYPNDGSIVTIKTPEITVWFEDSLSGIAGENRMALYLDGKKVIAEWDPVLHKLFYTPRVPLMKGKHIVQFEVQDRMNNSAKKVWQFIIQ